ncbi:hypothetical protein [Deinococcus cellulosilyticus]|uniref:Inner membrane protein yeeR n=1 Tax=Deinococcus cellulosilyticus (strain DSM 18568 / NBRC 106333 / KACC 11606 / 5516J-15) TaxID=1223518 RepID=A0A511N266_DEIC1|nr:hypothetical protein [Deinococcus cellulosilyticus]GEM46955.1 hypothetical protein DC3_25900 [Deinococcus cellulosilyticus NBRC 106333 = KACC 11606]
MSKQDVLKQNADIAGIAEGINQSAENYSENAMFNNPRGHGLAAEHANHMFDVLTGQKAEHVGSNNIKDGADRIVNGIQIQSKYCASGGKCVQECFNEQGHFRYLNPDGTPMQIEVPSDMYDSAVQSMRTRIEKGTIPGVSDPAEAENIIRKGHFTYEQVKRIAQAGTIEGLTYDAVRGIRLAGTSAGITAVISFAVGIWRKEDIATALKTAVLSGLHSGGVAWVSSIAAAQVGRTGLEKGLRPATDWVVKQLGPKATRWIATGLRNGKPLYGAAAASHVSKILRGNVVTSAITVVVLSSQDMVKLFRRQISGAQLFKNVTITTASVAGGVGGTLAASAIGTMIFPGVGTVVGALIGITGGLLGGKFSKDATQKVMDRFIQDDSRKLLSIIENVFVTEAEGFLLSEQEGEAVVAALRNLDLGKKLLEMHASKDHQEYARQLLVPLMEAEVAKREKVTPPSEEELMVALAEVLEFAAD